MRICRRPNHDELSHRVDPKAQSRPQSLGDRMAVCLPVKAEPAAGAPGDQTLTLNTSLAFAMNLGHPSPRSQPPPKDQAVHALSQATRSRNGTLGWRVTHDWRTPPRRIGLPVDFSNLNLRTMGDRSRQAKPRLCGIASASISRCPAVARLGVVCQTFGPHPGKDHRRSVRVGAQLAARQR